MQHKERIEYILGRMTIMFGVSGLLLHDIISGDYSPLFNYNVTLP